MNCVYEMITKENAGSFSSAQLIVMYNDAVETIWFLQKRLQELSFLKRTAYFVLSIINKTQIAF